MIFEDRRQAGKLLARQLSRYAKKGNVIVLGIPRGGVVVADEVAIALEAPLDVFIARKIGAPFNHELAIGAIASDGTVFLDQALISELGVSAKQVELEREEELREIQRRVEMYRSGALAYPLENRIAILVDDGVATGATTVAALRALKKQNPERRILAIPVAPRQVVPILSAECEELVLLDTPDPFYAVGCFYRDFGQTTDEDVVRILASARARLSHN